MARRVFPYIACALALLLLAARSHAQQEAPGKPSLFKDPEDGAFDVSGWIATRTGFIAIPIVITEPAVGYGGGLALAFFHGAGLASREEGVTGRPLTPSASVVGGMATENGTWAALAAHQGIWKKDRYRYRGALAYFSPNLDFYGTGDQPFRFNLEGWLLFQELRARLWKTDVFAGVRYVYQDLDPSFETERPAGTTDRRVRQSGAGAVASYDIRDSMFTPNRGTLFELSATFYSQDLGGDDDYQRYKGTALLFWDVHPRLVLGARLEADVARGDTPFYAKPFIMLRGIPALRYQDDAVTVADFEARWTFWKRWTLVAFAGAGKAADELFTGGRDVHSGGLGFRYLVARSLGLQMGIDVAKGPEDTAFYVVFGSSWLR